MSDFNTNNELKNNSTLQNYLNNAKIELNINNADIKNSRLESLRKTVLKIDEKESNLKTVFNSLSQKRLDLYENLISIVIYKRYISIINNDIEEYKKSRENLKILNDSNILSNINEVMDIKSIGGNNKILSKRLDNYKLFFNDLFNKEKETLGYKDIKVGADGKLIGTNNVYSINGLENFTGTFTFKNDSSFVSFEEKIRKMKPSDDAVTLELKNTADITVECGNDKYPYIIKNANDKKLVNSEYYQKQTTLALNNDINLTLSKKQTKNIGSIYTTIKGNNNRFNINLQAEKTILNFPAIYEKTQFVITGTGELEINIRNFDKNIKLGSNDNLDTDYGCRFFFSGFTKVNVYFIGGTNNIIKDDEKLEALKKLFFVTNDQASYTGATPIGSLLDLFIPSPDQVQVVFNGKKEEITDTSLTSIFDDLILTGNTIDKSTIQSGISMTPLIIKKDEGTFKITAKKGINSNNNIIFTESKAGTITFDESGKIIGLSLQYKIESDSNNTATLDLDIDNVSFSTDNNVKNSDLNLLSGLATLANLDNDITDNALTEAIASLKTALSNKKDQLNSLINSIANKINKSFLSIEQILALRNANDTSYNYDYIENIMTEMSNASGYISVLLQDETDQINTETYFNKMILSIKSTEVCCDDILIGLVYGINKLTNIIENYSCFFKNNKEYETLLEGAITSAYDAIIGLDEEYYQSYGSIRSFANNWKQKITKYTSAGMFDIAPLYISYELGLNFFEINLYSLINERLISIFKKGLFLSPYKTEIFNYEKELYEKYNITITENAGYEILPPVLTDEILDLAFINSLNINECIHSMNNPKMKKLKNIIELVFLKYFSRNNETFLDKIILIKSILSKMEKNIKCLIIEDCFYDILTKLAASGKINGLNDKLIEIGIKEETLLDYNLLISKYISVWNLKYCSFKDTKICLLILGGSDFSNFVHYESNDEKNNFLTDSEKVNEVIEFIKILWNGLVDMKEA